jgi:ferredoxin
MVDYPKFILKASDLDSLFVALKKNNYQIVGPTIRDKAIIYDFIKALKDLPIGYNDQQDNGQYRISHSEKETIFSGYTVGQNSLRQFIYPPEKTILNISKKDKNLFIEDQIADIPRLAVIGLRACELSAIRIQDKILTQGSYIDNEYLKTRKEMFIIAVNCGNPGNTCFCYSMNTGPVVTDGFDLALTEINNDGESYFVTEVGSEKGDKLLKALSLTQASEQTLGQKELILESAKSKMGRKLPIKSLTDSLSNQFDNPYWDEIAGKCLSCGNCTMVCPTCFCVDFRDETNLIGEMAVRLRHWDSCYNTDFSYIHGGSIRSSGKSRYRQWLMHKLSFWNDQFDVLGCVGCGRCITWCPVGIDITEEASRICSQSK